MKHVAMMLMFLLGTTAVGVAMAAPSGSPAVFVAGVKQPMGKTFPSVVQALQKNGFRVVMKIDVGKKLAFVAKKFHWKDYNLNHLTAIRSIVFCNAKYANAISNADPQMMALCPLHVTLVQQGGVTQVEFVKPAELAKGTKAARPAEELQEHVIHALEAGLKAAGHG